MDSTEYNLYKFFTIFPYIEQFIECYLVQNNARPAYLLDQCNCSSHQNNTNGWFSKIMNISGLFSIHNDCVVHSSIKKWFPELTETYMQGIGRFISKDKIQVANIHSNDDIGRILGYPAWNGFDNLNRNEIYYSFGIQITFKNFPNQYSHLFQPISIINNASANDITDEMEIIRKKVEYVLKSKAPEKLLVYIAEFIDTITIEKTIHFPIKYLINKLFNNEILLEEEKTEIRTIIWNIMTSNYNISDYDFEWHNQIHIGIIISLLLRHDYDELEPFYSEFYNKSSKAEKSCEINKNYAIALTKILDLSRIKK